MLFGDPAIMISFNLSDINKKLPNFVREGNGNPFQYSCLENPFEPGRLQSMGSDMTELDKSWTRLSN